jgi:hypothetical protein
MNPLRMLILLAALTVATVPALAECTISGHVTATENVDMPELGYWMYTLEVTWDTDSQTSLSHLDFVLDLPGSTCDCSDFEYALAFADIAGESNGTPDDCTVQYEAFLECFGDPSIPIDGILIKWEPLVNDEGCEPGPIGTGTFTFYSDLDPVEIDTDLPLLVEKNSGESCEGGVTGVFPGLLCNPVGAEASSWSQIKGIYRQ